jgi:glycosyltransferase involved in cell wall biosynthesis
VSRLAVVVPVYNEAAGIRATLEALARQTDGDFDVVFVDNDSTDDSVAVIESFRQPRWRVIHESQKGTGAARSEASDWSGESSSRGRTRG